ncbi:MAG: sigma-70 family RNA polymerase sigma factor, partial [Acidobacteria bacterium]|nr:sigma-70 family RNA polymerase sigma factor [Acidobacteriota bacterium]
MTTLTTRFAESTTQTKPLEVDDCDLVERMATRDADALGVFYDRYNRLVFGLVLRIVGNRNDAEDILLDVFWQVWQQSSRFDAWRGKPVAWLLTIARTRAIDCIRANNRQHSRNSQFDMKAGSFDDPHIRSTVQEALASLSHQQRTVLEMAYFEGLSHTEIAAALRQPL